jgi:hypothetical protein
MNFIRQMLLPCVCVISWLIAFSLYTNNVQIPVNSVSYAQTPVPDPIPSVTPAIAKIKGPSTVLAGTLLFLSADDASGDNFKWLIPEELTQTSAICSNNIFFAIPTPGEYTFGLVAVNKSADIDVAYHKVKVTTHPGNGPPPVVNPTPTPTPTPSPSFDKVIKTSIEGLEKLKDPTTATALKLALNLLISEAGTKSLQELRIETIRLTTSTFLNRKGESLKKEWGQLWVEPIDAAIVELNLKDAKTYVDLLKTLVKTL